MHYVHHHRRIDGSDDQAQDEISCQRCRFVLIALEMRGRTALSDEHGVAIESWTQTRYHVSKGCKDRMHQGAVFKGLGRRTGGLRVYNSPKSPSTFPCPLQTVITKGSMIPNGSSIGPAIYSTIDLPESRRAVEWAMTGVIDRHRRQ